jgi:hypothetical protein
MHRQIIFGRCFNCPEQREAKQPSHQNMCCPYIALEVKFLVLIDKRSEKFYFPLEVEKGFSLSKEIFHNEKKQIDILRL